MPRRHRPSISMHQETFDRLGEYARRSGRKRTSIAEEAIHEYLSRRGIPGQWPSTTGEASRHPMGCTSKTTRRRAELATRRIPASSGQCPGSCCSGDGAAGEQGSRAARGAASAPGRARANDLAQGQP